MGKFLEDRFSFRKFSVTIWYIYITEEFEIWPAICASVGGMLAWVVRLRG